MRQGPAERGEAEAYLLERLRGLLAMGYQPHETAAERAAIAREFVGAVGHRPVWMLAEVCDQWASTRTRRPTAAELRIMADRIEDEVNAEARHREGPRPDGYEAQPAGDPDRCKEILAAAGYDPDSVRRIREARMATDREQIEPMPDRRPHWSETAPPDDPRFEALRRSRERALASLPGGEK